MHCNIGGLAALVFLMTRTEEIPWYFWEFAYNNYLHSRFLYVLKWIFICGKIGKTFWVSKGENVTLIYIIYFENFVILLSLRFYVKSILGNCRSAKSAILTHLGQRWTTMGCNHLEKRLDLRTIWKNFNDFPQFLLYFQWDFRLYCKVQKH